MEESEVNRLLNRLIDGSINPEDFARLQGAMRVNPEIRAEYYDLVGIDLMLAERYEIPTHISDQAKAMNDHWVVGRSKRKMVTGIVLAAAAVVMLTLGSVFFFQSQQPTTALSASVDCNFSINGAGRSDTLKKDELLKVETGILSMQINPYVEACVEGPARLLLRDDDGKLELQEGSIFLQIQPGGKGFEVHTPAGIIRDIGTQFGVHVASDGTVETHVSSGSVEVERQKGERPHRVQTGESATWTRTGTINRGRNTADRFVRALPSEEALFSDDFDEPDGTPLDKKKPDDGEPWSVLMEMNPTTVGHGMLDTSKGPRTIRAKFLQEKSTGRRKVYVVSFSTRVPENIWDKAAYLDAAERITFHRKGGAPLFSMVARFSRNHHWQLKNETDASHSYGISVSALDPHRLTLTYDTGTGMVRLYEGSNLAGSSPDSMKVQPGVLLDSLMISNDQGGDVAVDDLTVRLLTYSQASGLTGGR